MSHGQQCRQSKQRRQGKIAALRYQQQQLARGGAAHSIRGRKPTLTHQESGLDRLCNHNSTGACLHDALASETNSQQCNIGHRTSELSEASSPGPSFRELSHRKRQGNEPDPRVKVAQERCSCPYTHVAKGIGHCGQPNCCSQPVPCPAHSSGLAPMHGTITWHPLVPLLCRNCNDCVY